MSKTAIIYARVSTTRQADDELPIDSQLQRCKEKAEELDASVAKVFVDRGISGTQENRPAFQDAIEYSELYSPTYFITWSTSRFARDRLTSMMYKRRLSKASTEIVYISMPIDRDTDAGMMMEGMMELMDEYYSRQISSDVKRSMIQNAKNGFFNGGKPPYGYTTAPYSGDQKRRILVPNPQEVDIVDKVFKLKLEGFGSKIISGILNDDHIQFRGGPWRKDSVLRLLKSDAVRGLTVFNKVDRKNGIQRARDQWICVKSHQAIVDIDTWEIVQDMIKSEAPKADTSNPLSTWLFTGLLKCGKCGASMQLQTATGGAGKRYNYYNCRNAITSGTCKGRRLHAEQVDSWLLEVILNDILNAENMRQFLQDIKSIASNWSVDHKQRRQSLEARLRATNKKVKKLYEVLEELGKDAPNFKDIAPRLRQHNDMIKSIEDEITALNNESPPKIEVDDKDIDLLAETLGDLIRQRDDKKKIRAFLSSVIKSITIEKDQAEIIYDQSSIVSGAVNKRVHSNQKWWAVCASLRTKTLRINVPPFLQIRSVRRRA